MKKLIIILIVVLYPFSLILTAENIDNNQHEWFPIGAEWFYESGNDLDPQSIPVVEHYFVEKDTIVDGKSCRIIRSSDTKDIMFEENGRVYYYFKGKFRKIYDFSVNVNDIVNLEFKTALNKDMNLDSTVVIPCTIEKIDTVYCGNVSLKRARARYSTSFGQGLYIYIEKVGCEFPGMFVKDFVPYLIPGLVYIPESYRRLRCYHDKYFDFITDWCLSVEAVYNQISGVWYKVFSYSGLTGKKDTIYSDEVNEIKRISGTDSIAWTISENNIVKSISKFRLTYVDSYLHGDKRWMLTSDGLKLLFEADSLFMTCGIDAYDAGALGYSRKKLVSGFSLPDKDEFRYYVDPLGLILNISGLPDIEYVSFYDVNGRLLHKATPLPNGSFDIRSLEKGLHIFQVVSKNTVYPGKIIKK